MHGRINNRMTIDLSILTIPRRGTSSFHRGGVGEAEDWSSLHSFHFAGNSSDEPIYQEKKTIHQVLPKAIKFQIEFSCSDLQP